jgi:tetratricopeptide (TPR) repeat protein
MNSTKKRSDFLSVGWVERSFLLILIMILLSASAHAGSGYAYVRLIVAATEKEAEEILEETGKGASFAFLAKEKSIDRSGEKYGDLGRVAVKDFEKPLRDVLSGMEEGETSEVVKLGDGRYAIVQIVDLSFYREGAKAFRAKNYLPAEKNLIRHIELNPDAVKARMMLGVIYESRKEYDKAERVYRDLLTYEPGHEGAYENLGRLYAAAKQFHKMKELYSEGLNRFPDKDFIKAGLKEAEARIRAEEKSSQPPAAPAPSGKKTDVQKKVLLRLIVVESRAEAGHILEEIRKGKAFALLAKEKSIDETSRKMYGLIGEVAVASLDKPIREAVSDLREEQTSGVIALDESRFAIVQLSTNRYYEAGEKAFIAENYDTAEKNLLRHLELNPDSPRSLTMLGKIYEDGKEYNKAEEMYTNAILIDPGVELSHIRLGRLYLKKGEFLKARKTFEEGLKIFPSSALLDEGLEIADILLIREGKNAQ